MPAPTTTHRPLRLRVAALSVVLAVLLAACAPAGAPGTAPGGDQPGGMPHDQMPMGQMHDTTDDSHEEQAPAPVEGAAEVRISATEMAFAPAELDLAAGEPVNITVVNDGDVFHDFDVPAAGIHLDLDPGEQTTAAITLDEPGTYEATCTVPGHANAGMTLTIHVS